MTINKQCFEIAGVTEKDYLNWCRENKKSAYKASSKREFFERIQDGRLVKDSMTGQLVKKRKKSK